MKAKELAKAAKILSKYKSSTRLNYDERLRNKIVQAALLDDDHILEEICAEIATAEEGDMHLMRAFNNCMPLANPWALKLAKYLYFSAKSLEESFKVVKLTQALHSVRDSLPELGWLCGEATRCLKDLAKNQSDEDRENYLKLLLALTRAELRTDANAETLIHDIAPLRVNILSKAEEIAFKQSFYEAKNDWEQRSAALFMLSANRDIPYRESLDFIDEAYHSFPLEALKALEALSILVETDFSKAYDDVIDEE
ncbi:MAG: hypothetical protein WC966_03105 [Bradymonadales bacterium]|jgi:hypothetical protein